MNRVEAVASFDVETDGPNPLDHSLLSLGIVLFVEERTEEDQSQSSVDQFCRQIGKAENWSTDQLTFREVDKILINVRPRPDARPDERCMREFWAKHPERWEDTQTDALDPAQAMAKLSDWLRSHEEQYRIIWASKPACFDWMFLKSYYDHFGPVDRYPIGFYCHCVSSMLRGWKVIFKFYNQHKATMLEHVLSESLPHTHNALDDARQQGTLYMNLRRIQRMYRPD